jgi:RNA polymerase-binding transcription factor DksA
MEPDNVTPRDDDTATPHDTGTPNDTGTNAAPATALDLDGIERDLADVEVALARLDAGTYWTDEITGQSLDEARLVDHPTARRAEG